MSAPGLHRGPQRRLKTVFSDEVRGWRSNFAVSDDIRWYRPFQRTLVARRLSRAEQIQAAREQFGNDFARRLTQLAAARPAYGGRRLQWASLEAMLRFVSRHDEWQLPEVLLAPNGNVQTQWRSRDERIVAQFLAGGDVWFTIIERGNPMLTGRRSPDEFVTALGVHVPIAAQ